MEASDTKGCGCKEEYLDSRGIPLQSRKCYLSKDNPNYICYIGDKIGDNDFEILSLDGFTAPRVSEMIPAWNKGLIPIDNLEDFIRQETAKINFLNRMKREGRVK